VNPLRRASFPHAGETNACDPLPSAVGYCLYPGCRRFAEPVETLARGRRFHCGVCRRSGWRETPRGARTGRVRPYREVRVLHAFRPLERRYGRQAIVRDESLGPDHRSFVLTSPFVADAKQALELAEALFWLLNTTGDERMATALCLGSDPRLPWQATISLDAPREEFRAQLTRVMARWADGGDATSLTTPPRSG